MESGIVIPTSEGVDFHLQHIQDALSYCENVSILIVKPDFSEIKSTMQRLSAADLNLLQKALSAERDQRREIFKCLGRIPEIRDTMESVERLFYTSNYSYLAPLFRLLRDHHLYAWYETLVLINAVEEMAAENKPILIKIDLFAEHDVVLAVSKTGNDYLVFTGPIVMESPSQSDGKFQQDVIGSLTKFNSDLSRELGRGRSTATGTYDLDSKAPLYSVNYLSRHAFLRQKTHHDDLLYAHHKVVTLFSGMMASSLLRERSHVLP
ncbi:MAG TPA: hypothetical protein VMM15_39220, partial [Bradyrhizobium sp.]|nr:hypothetical protein [Bradyrhizobium sp.]